MQGHIIFLGRYPSGRIPVQVFHRSASDLSKGLKTAVSLESSCCCRGPCFSLNQKFEDINDRDWCQGEPVERGGIRTFVLMLWLELEI